MKKITLLFLLSFLIFEVNAQISKDYQKKIEKFIKSYPAWTYVPETSFKTADGIIKAGNFLMFSEEVSNLHWKEFVAYTLKDKGKEAADALLPDSSLWLELENYQETFKIYHYNPIFNNYPIVNINYIQAEAYCKWLEDFYNSRENKFYKKVTVSLPTEQEWVYAAMGGNQQAIFSWSGLSVYDKKNQLQGNFYQLKQTDVYYGEGQTLTFSGSKNSYKWLNPNGNSPTETESFMPNAYGLYNMSGNVAEFVKAAEGENCDTKGGSWGDPGYYLQINTKQTCNINKSASPFRGFRPVLRMEF